MPGGAAAAAPSEDTAAGSVGAAANVGAVTEVGVVADVGAVAEAGVAADAGNAAAFDGDAAVEPDCGAAVGAADWAAAVAGEAAATTDWVATVAGEAAVATDCVAAVAGATAASVTCTVTISAPADTSSPFFNSTELTTPFTGDGTSMEAFSVSSVIRGSSIRISLPLLTSTSTTLTPLASPKSGMRTSTRLITTP